MSLQELIKAAELDISEGQIKAFFLGAQIGDKPLTFSKTMGELFADIPDEKKTLENELNKLWDSLVANTEKELANLFKGPADLKSYLTTALQRLDFFLTGLSLAGSFADKKLTEASEELENVVLDLDDYILEGNTDLDADELKDQLEGAWDELLSLRF